MSEEKERETGDGPLSPFCRLRSQEAFPNGGHPAEFAFFALKRIEFSLCKVNAYVSSMNRILILCVFTVKSIVNTLRFFGNKHCEYFAFYNGNFKITPLEVKSSKNYTTISLNDFIKRFHGRTIHPCVIHPKQFRYENGITYLPVYMTCFL